MRYTSAGAPDQTFGTGGVVREASTGGRGLTLQADGKPVVVGSSDNNYFFHGFVAQAKYDGTPDASFGNNGLVLTSVGSSSAENYFTSAAVTPSGEIVAAGSSHDAINPTLKYWTLARFFGSAPSLTLDPASDTGVSNSDQLTDVATPTFDVPAYPGFYERIYRNGILVSSAYAAGGTVKLSAAQPAGNNTYSMTFVDAAGNESPVAATDSITIDLSAQRLAHSLRRRLRLPRRRRITLPSLTPTTRPSMARRSETTTFLSPVPTDTASSHRSCRPRRLAMGAR